jgi:hypothetical protein
VEETIIDGGHVTYAETKVQVIQVRR